MASVLFLRKEEKHVKIERNDILFLSSSSKGVDVVTTQNSFFVNQNLKRFVVENDLPFLVRVHRSYYVNIHRVDSFDQSFVYLGSHRIPVGASCRQLLMAAIRDI